MTKSVSGHRRPARVAKRCQSTVLAAAVWLAMAVPSFAETSYTFGVVPQFEPRKLADIWAPILAEITKRTGLK